MSLRSLFRVAVPASLALILSISFDVGQIFPVCIFAFLFFFLCRVFASDVGLYSVIAVVTTVVLSFFCFHTSIIPCEASTPECKNKKQRKTKKEVILNQDRKKRNKDKKRKKGKPMEDDKENTQMSPEGTKIYKPLKEYVDLRMTKEDLHYYFSQYTLDREQMARNRYPRPGIPSSEAFSPNGEVRRKCNRCGKIFHVSLKGGRDKRDVCLYHPQRPKPINGVLVHECCGKSSEVSGCKCCVGHVCAEPILHNVKFKNVREKRHVRTEHLCSVYALDCEMVYTSFGLQLAKIGIVNLEGLTIYESFVLPENDIIDFNTTYSGIRAKDLRGVTTTLADVQTFLDHILNQDSILVGHGLENDLKVLRLMHDKVVDTGVIFPRANGTKSKLKELALKYLNKSIQDNPNGHDCIEDARTCMALMLYRIKQDQKESLATMESNYRPVLNPYNQITSSSVVQYEPCRFGSAENCAFHNNIHCTEHRVFIPTYEMQSLNCTGYEELRVKAALASLKCSV